MQQNFEKQYWTPLDKQTQATLKEMERLAQVVKTSKEIGRAFEEGDFFIQEIVSQGRVLYEQKQ